MRARPEFLPTPRQIAEKCAEIRSRWTPAERRRRSVAMELELPEPSWLPPQIDTANCYARVRHISFESC